MDPLLTTIANRPYVLAVVVVFWILAPLEIGWRRAIVWFVTGTLLGWLAEFASTRTGIPFGGYTYHPANFPGELWIGGVPPFASVSFAALTYLGYSATLTLLAPLRHDDGVLVALVTPALEQSRGVLILAALIPTWLDMVVDPVTHLGRYWMLGDLYHYEPPGVHFGVPIANYLGWIVTCLAIVRVNQLLAPSLGYPRRSSAADLRLPLQPFWSLGSILGNMLFMLGVTVYLMSAPAVPPETPLPGILASGAALTAAFAVFAALMIRHGFSRPLVL